MNQKAMTSMERVLTTLSHKEPDRVPMFLLTTMHGAKELDLSIKEYFSHSDNVVKGQMRLREKYRNDCIYTFFYAPVETEAFGGGVIYYEDGPPNSADPCIKDSDEIRKLNIPDVKSSASLLKVLKATEKLKSLVKDEVPIIGVVMSPFSLPVMQMGFEEYLKLIFFEPELFQTLMKVNEEFCVQWANAQLEAGATAICYFDPVSSSSIIQPEEYLKTGFEVAKRTISRIKGPTATHFASGKSLPILDKVAETGTAVAAVSVEEDLREIKNKCSGKLSILGNLNGIEMRKWSSEHTREIVGEAISKAAEGGGFILGDNHGEIPFQVPDNVLLDISEAVHELGRYPIVTQKE